MTNSFNNPSNFSPFLSPDIIVPEEEDRKRVFLIDTLTKFVDAINNKDIGIYAPIEVETGQNWYYNTKPRLAKYGLRTIVYVPDLISGTYPHGISGIDENFSITRLYGTASNPTTFDYIEFVNQGNPDITFTMDNTNIIVTSTLTGYRGFFVIDYLRQNF